MLAGDFARKLKALSSKLQITCGDNDARPAGLFYELNGEYEDLCGIDKEFVPELKTCTWNGFVVKQGWRDVLTMLIARKFCTREAAERMFNANLTYKSPVTYVTDPTKDPLNIQRQQLMEEAKYGEVDARRLAEISLARKVRGK